MVDTTEPECASIKRTASSKKIQIEADRQLEVDRVGVMKTLETRCLSEVMFLSYVDCDAVPGESDPARQAPQDQELPVGENLPSVAGQVYLPVVAGVVLRRSLKHQVC